MYCTNRVNIIYCLLRFNQHTSDDRLVRSLHVGSKINIMCNGWKSRALPSHSLWRKLRVGNNCSGFLGCVDLRNDDTTDEQFCLARNHSVSHKHQTHCAPASRALLIKSGCDMRSRTSGETPMLDIAAVALCIALSSILPCSQSMMIPCSPSY